MGARDVDGMWRCGLADKACGGLVVELNVPVGSEIVNDATVIDLVHWRICVVHYGILFAG